MDAAPTSNTPRTARPGVTAARLVLPNRAFRPGALVLSGPMATPGVMKLPPAFQMDGSLGSRESPPQRGVIGTGDGALDLRGARARDQGGRGGSTERTGGTKWG